MECYRCAANQVLTYLSLILVRELNAVRCSWVVFLEKTNRVTTIIAKSKCRLLRSIIKCEVEGGEKKHEKFQSFYCARFNFLLLCKKRYSSLAPLSNFNAGTCTLNQGSSVHFSRNRKWKVFHSERGFRYFFVVQFKCFTQSVLQTEKVSFYNIAREASYGLWPLMTSVASNSLSDIKWEHLRLRLFEAIRIY